MCVCVCVCVYTPGIQNYQAPNKIQFTIPDSHRRAASKETGKYNGKKWFIETQLELTYMLELSEKNIK